MKTRITYVHDSGGQFDPQQVSVQDDSLSVRSLEGAREVKLTADLDELPGELPQVLRQWHDLQIHWAAERPFRAVAPFASRVSPGLHVSYTPSDAKTAGDESLCSLLRKVFTEQLKCSLPESSFVSSPVTSTRSHHFYQILPSLEGLVTYIRQNICPLNDGICHDHASSLSSADYTDISYEQGSSSISITGYRSEAPQKDGWTETIYARKDEKVEAGILATQEPLGPAELRVGGFLAVVGRDKELKPTLFSFPSRHHPLPESSVYETRFSQPTGLHPTLKLSIPRHALSLPPAGSKAACSLHSFITLPSTVFADKYQLSTTDPLFLESHNLVSLRSIAGETDLEVPDWVTDRWGSNFLLELATPQPQQVQESPSDKWEVSIPLHLRYLHPSASGHRNISVPWPIVFWACASGEDEAKLDKNPFDRTNLTWDELFTPRTIFYQLHPSTTGREVPKSVEDVRVPVLQVRDGPDGNSRVKSIELGTVLAIVVGFVWVLWKLGLVARKYGVESNQPSSNQPRKTKEA